MGLPYQIVEQSESERNAFAMWRARQRNRIEEPVAVRCKGCGAYHADDEWCAYCGNGRPSVPKVKRKPTSP